MEVSMRGMHERLVNLLAREKLLCVGYRAVVREGARFKVYLPKSLNPLFEELAGCKVLVFIALESKNEGGAHEAVA